MARGLGGGPSGLRLSQRPGRRRWLADWRVWVGVGVTAVALYWTLRDVPLAAIGRALRAADPLAVALMAVPHLLGLWLRALRWRRLTAPVVETPLPVGSLYRATAVGFMTSALFPLRLGEIVRPWLLSRETEISASAALGTVALERALDFAAIALIGAAVLFAHTRVLPDWVQAGAAVLLALACLPLGLAVVLRRRPETMLALVRRLLGVLPDRASEPLLGMVVQVLEGLDTLRGGRAIVAVAMQTVVLWGLLLVVPFGLGLLAVDASLSPGESVLAAYTAYVFTALAVAAPSVPGFFGVYHLACREALALFGVPPALAVAYGTIVHITYWVPIAAAGLLATAASGARLRDLASPEVVGAD
jgi:uncharacterized protein (TIRG00374 family)